jgi:hypothetical protein
MSDERLFELTLVFSSDDGDFTTAIYDICEASALLSDPDDRERLRVLEVGESFTDEDDDIWRRVA